MKKILLSITLVGASFLSQAQTLFSENFDGLTVGNLGTDLTGGAPGQGNWGTAVTSGGANTDFQIVNIGASDNELQLKGPVGATDNNTTKYAFHYFDWSSRTAGNDVLFTEFKFNTGASTGITSTNDFRVAIYNDSWSKLIAGISYNPKTKTIYGQYYTVGNNGPGTYNLNIGNGGVAVPALAANSDVTIQIAFDKISGNIYWNGTGGGQTFSYSVSGGSVGETPGEIDVFVRGGVSNGAAAFTTCTFDDFSVKAQPCADPSLTSRDAAVSINYTSSSYCKDLVSVLPVMTPPTSGGTFISSSNLTYVGQTTAGQSTTGNINPSLSVAGGYVIAYYTAGSATSCSYISKDTIFIKALPAVPTIVASGALSFCPSDSVILSTVAALNTSYAWSNSSTNDSITVNTSGSYTVTATLSGCSSTSIATVVDVKPLEDATFAYTSNTLCVGGPNSTPVLTDANVVGQFTSTPSGLTVDPSTGEIDLSNSTAGTYTVKFISNGTSVACVDSSEQVVTLTTSPSADFNYAAASFCNSESNQAVAFTNNGSAGVFSVDNANLSINPTSGLINVAQSTPGNYVVTNTINVSGCALTSATYNVEIKATPTVTVSAPAVCAGSTATVTATPGVSGTYTYAWTVPSGTTPANTVSTFNPTVAGQYSVVITNPTTGCASQSANATLTINALPTVSVSAPAVCAGTTATVTANPGVAGTYTYTWTVPSGTAPTTSSFNPTVAGQYSVVITNPTTLCSSQSANVTLTINPLPAVPTITANGPTTFCSGGNVVLTSAASNGYSWSNQATTQAITVAASGSYSVTITDGNGCSNVSVPTLVTVNDCAGIEENSNNTFVVYPNPANETINVTFSNLSDNGTVQLFTAEGKVIESKEISNSMTATFDVVNLTSGVYYVVITSDNGRVSQKVIIE